MSATVAASTPTVSLFDIPIAAVTMDAALDLIDRAIVDRRPLQIGVVNAAKVVNMGSDAGLRGAVLSSDVIFADGASVVWASRLLGAPLPERVAGIDLMTGMLARGNTRHYRVFCLGATEEVLAATVARIRAEYPGVEVVGHHHGYFKRDKEERVARMIAIARPDILFVAMTSPKKEEFMARWSDEMKVPICHGVGGSFDVMAGKVKRAPELWQRLGLEWLYRVKQEPGRLWKRYLVTNVQFIMMVAREVFRPARGRKADPIAAVEIRRR
jgi:N-acetylglucosaminyldiphosphoundecaprenol N-acetyl-beta-D-mannosaminyltransferase